LSRWISFAWLPEVAPWFGFDWASAKLVLSNMIMAATPAIFFRFHIASLRKALGDGKGGAR
jgi:hypothetical protein